VASVAADDFEAFMKQKKFPLGTQKDISDIQSVLRLRKMVFSNSIKLTAPPEAFQDMVTVESIEGNSKDGTEGQDLRGREDCGTFKNENSIPATKHSSRLHDGF
jgi:hypothetical protein